jgi:thiol-disulfide isomerase/thioredoxin
MIKKVLNGLFLLMLVVVLVNPAAKALVIQGLMTVGFFQPRLDSEEPKAITAANALPDVTFKDTEGKTIHLADLKGKVVFLNFWATWCPPCIAEMPSINKLYEKLRSNPNIVFLIVDADHDFNKSVPFMKKRRFTMPICMLTSNVPETLVSNSIPTTTIIDKAGRITFHQEGSADYSNPKIATYLESIAK